ncbi:MAG: DUF3631 domain-containing protein, partial [Rhodanobacteraceae bacterium]
KTRALEVTSSMVPSPVMAVNTTPAYLFRKVGSPDGAPTILYEIETVFGPKAKDNEEIRGLLNAGHRKGAVAGRCVVRGKEAFTEEIPAYAAVALAGLGGLPDTILSRAVVIRMRRRSPTERVEPYRARINEAEGAAIGVDLAAWCQSVSDRVDWPEMPPGVEDRSADVWEALLMIADAAGGDWPERARVAAVALVAELREANPSLGVRLLADIRNVFGDADEVPTKDLLQRLHAIEDGPWRDLKGRPLDARGLSYRLRQYGIGPTSVRNGDRTPKGYRRVDLYDAWIRYLPPPADKSATAATSATSEAQCGLDRCGSVADVADDLLANGALKANGSANVADVADVAHLANNGAAAVPDSLDKWIARDLAKRTAEFDSIKAQVLGHPVRGTKP